MSFDRLAPHYRWMETMLAGGLLQRCRTHWLGEISDPPRILLAGEGRGRMLDACIARFPQSEFLVLDHSQAMLERTARHVRRSGKKFPITFHQADLREWRNQFGYFDLIISHFVLDCFSADELPRVVKNLAAATAPRTIWLLADFCVPPAGWRRLRARAILALAYSFFRVTTKISASRIVPPDDALREAGFVMRRRKVFNYGLLHTDLWERN